MPPSIHVKLDRAFEDNELRDLPALVIEYGVWEWVVDFAYETDCTITAEHLPLDAESFRSDSNPVRK